MNNQENKNKQQTQDADKEGARGKAPQAKGFKALFAKRWTFPVIYLAASVLIVGLMYAKSKDASFEIKKPAEPKTTTGQVGPVLPSGTDQSATPANATPSFMWPVGEDGTSATISMGFYNSGAGDDAKAQAVVSYDNKFFPHEGVDIGLKSDKPFTVVAAAKGTVTDVSEDPLMGYTVTIDNGDGYSTYYASLTDVEVQKGALVMRGQPIAKSSNDSFEKSEMNHLHFEVRKDGVQIDPNSILTKMPIGDATQSSANSTTPAAPTGSSAAGTAADNSSANSPTSGSPVDKAVNGSSSDNSSATTSTAPSTDSTAASDSSSATTTSSDSTDANGTDANSSTNTSTSTDSTTTSTQGQAADTSTDSTGN